MRAPDEKKSVPSHALRLDMTSVAQAGLAFLLAMLIAYCVSAL